MTIRLALENISPVPGAPSFHGFIVKGWGIVSGRKRPYSPKRRQSQRTGTIPTGLRRFQQTGELHFITFSCVRHRPILGTPEARNTFLQILEQTRTTYDLDIYAYVAMPTHVHLLVSEPRTKTLAVVIQVLKQRFSRTRPEDYVWEPRYHDFNVYTDDKRAEKLHYIHHNPVKAGIVATPEQYPWSSHLSYTTDHPGPVHLFKPWRNRVPHPFTASS